MQIMRRAPYTGAEQIPSEFVPDGLATGPAAANSLTENGNQIMRRVRMVLGGRPICPIPAGGG
jgi:hypothetical protein